MIDINEHYIIQKPKYEGLLEAVKFSLDKIISKNNIKLFDLEGRVKDLISLKEKMTRKTYSNPFDDIEDICGVRIICYYTTDMDMIENMIKSEFFVLSASDKQKEADDDRFGYQSRHYIVKLKEEWLSIPIFNEFRDLKFEIQLRTMLMHTWAAISHALLYKHESDAPKEMKRKLNRLSALIELADEQFNAIRGLKSDYIEAFDHDDSEKNKPINADSIIILVNKYSPGRDLDDDEIPKLLEEIKPLEITIADFEHMIVKSSEAANRIEAELARLRGGKPLPMWSVVGFSRMVFDLNSDEYFNERFPEDDEEFAYLKTDEYWSMWISLVKKERAALNQE